MDLHPEVSSETIRTHLHSRDDVPLVSVERLDLLQVFIRQEKSNTCQSDKQIPTQEKQSQQLHRIIACSFLDSASEKSHFVEEVNSFQTGKTSCSSIGIPSTRWRCPPDLQVLQDPGRSDALGDPDHPSLYLPPGDRETHTHLSIVNYTTASYTEVFVCYVSIS